MTYILKLLKFNFVHSYWTDWCHATKHIGELILISFTVNFSVSRLNINKRKFFSEDYIKVFSRDIY